VADRRIEHVVVLMLENRSFDNLLGFLDHPRPEFPRLIAGAYSNPVDPADPTSRQVPVSADAGYSLPVDPPHSHKSALEQLGVRGLGEPRMNGFVSAYERKASGHEERPIIHWWRLGGLVLVIAALLAGLTAKLGGFVRKLWPVVFLGTAGGLGSVLSKQRKKVNHVNVVTGVGPQIMGCLAPDKIPVLGTLAREFAVCTRWHSSVPGETWPNRNFVHAATSDGSVDIEIGLYESTTIFERLERSGADWRIYHDGRAHVWAFADLWHGPRMGNWFEFKEFARHVDADDLPAYSFIEPNHAGPKSNSQHPGNNVRPQPDSTDFERGEQLVASIYESLRRNPAVFEKTLFLITYDEYGGLFDHVAPPRRVPAPAPLRKSRISPTRRFVSFFIERETVVFDFRMLGGRVPTIIVSPWIEPGTIDDQLYDHTSVIATLRALFAPNSAPLTLRDAAANTFHHLVRERSQPRREDELPDLSDRVAPERRRDREVVGAPPAPDAEEPPPEPADAGPEDEFSRQLSVLADRMRAELARQAPAASGAGAGASRTAEPAAHRGAPPGPGAPTPPPGPDSDVVAAFLAQAEARRAAAG
jgi:phospholipase C